VERKLYGDGKLRYPDHTAQMLMSRRGDMAFMQNLARSLGKKDTYLNGPATLHKEGVVLEKGTPDPKP
jgi:hypothetical protein